jgi:hypothetical protein
MDVTATTRKRLGRYARKWQPRAHHLALLAVLAAAALAGHLAGRMVGQHALLAQSAAYQDVRTAHMYTPTAAPQVDIHSEPPSASTRSDSHSGDNGEGDQGNGNHHDKHGGHGGN